MLPVCHLQAVACAIYLEHSALCDPIAPAARAAPHCPPAGGAVEFTWIVDDRSRPGVNLTSMTGLRNSLLVARTPVTTLGTLDYWQDRWGWSECMATIAPGTASGCLAGATQHGTLDRPLPAQPILSTDAVITPPQYILAPSAGPSAA